MIPVSGSGSGSGRGRRKPKPVFNAMSKCVVSGCPSRTGIQNRPNRMGAQNRGVFSRAPRRFFRFPTDPDRVKVWLAALRETDRDPSDQHFICEDHFLAEDITRIGISSDAIPVMPPYLDGSNVLTGSWSGDAFKEEEQWTTAGWGDEDDEQEEEEDAPEPPELNPNRTAENPSEPKVKRDFCPQEEKPDWFIREGVPFSRLARGFLELLMAHPDDGLDAAEAARKLQAHKHRVHAVIEVLTGLGLVETDSDGRVSWIGSAPIFSFLWRDTLDFLSMLGRLKVMEDEVDRLFKSCAQQLFTLTEDEGNATLAYVRCDDICRLSDLQQQTVIVIRSPPETKMTIPSPEEDKIEMHLKSENGPISVQICDMKALTSDPTNSSRVFSALESCVRMRAMNKGSSKKMKI